MKFTISCLHTIQMLHTKFGPVVLEKKMLMQDGRRTVDDGRWTTWTSTHSYRSPEWLRWPNNTFGCQGIWGWTCSGGIFASSDYIIPNKIPWTIPIEQSVMSAGNKTSAGFTGLVISIFPVCTIAHTGAFNWKKNSWLWYVNVEQIQCERKCSCRA